MIKARSFFVLCSLVVSILNTSAQAMDKYDRYRVIGDYSCSQVLDRSNALEVLAYVKGFATATNIWLQARKDHFKGMQTQELVKMVVLNCKKSPLSTLGSSLTTLVSELTSAY